MAKRSFLRHIKSVFSMFMSPMKHKRPGSFCILLIGLTILTIFYLRAAPQYVSPGDSLWDSVLKGVEFGILTIPFILPFIVVLTFLAVGASR